MTTEREFKVDGEALTYYVKDDVAIIRFKSHVFDIATNLERRVTFFSLIDSLKRSPDIKVLFLTNSSRAMGEDEYHEFMYRIWTRDDTGEMTARAIGERNGHMLMLRELNSLDYFVTKVLNFPKIVVVGFCGVVVTPFLAASLACDYRIGAENLVFKFPHLKYGAFIGGGLGYSLPWFVGQGKATQILLQGKPLKARDALRLGLINDILPTEEFETNCLEVIREFTRINPTAIARTKSALCCFRDELERHIKNQAGKADYGKIEMPDTIQ